MSTFAFPSVVPNEMNVDLRSNTSRYPSEISSAIQTKKRGGDLLVLNMSFRNLQGDDRANVLGFLVKLQGTRHRFTVTDYSHTSRGAFGGSPIVAGANQVGTQILVDGASNNITNWIRRFDRFQIGNELKICTDDASTNGSGQITISFAPRIRTSPADNSAVVTSSPVGIFMLADDLTTWSNRPGKDGPISDVAVVGIEDVRA